MFTILKPCIYFKTLVFKNNLFSRTTCDAAGYLKQSFTTATEHNTSKPTCPKCARSLKVARTVGRHCSALKTPNQRNSDKYAVTFHSTASSYHSAACVLLASADGSLAVINRNRWRLMSLNSVSGLSYNNPV